MSRSGVGLDKECVPAFEELKLGKKVKYIIYKLSDDKKTIVVEKTSTASDYDEFIGDLPEAGCRYAVYDFEYNCGEGEGTRNKICFYAWAPDNAPVREKMVYASSKEALRRALTAIGCEVQGTDYSEVSYEAVRDKLPNK